MEIQTILSRTSKVWSASSTDKAGQMYCKNTSFPTNYRGNMDRPAQLKTRPLHQSPPTMISILHTNCLGFLLSLLTLGRFVPDQISLREMHFYCWLQCCSSLEPLSQPAQWHIQKSALPGFWDISSLLHAAHCNGVIVMTPWHISVERPVGMMFRKYIFSRKSSITTLLAQFSPILYLICNPAFL